MKTPKKLKIWKKKFKLMDCLEDLKNHGFQRKRTGIWVNKKEGVVIKRSFICRSSIPAAAVPTIIIWDDDLHPILIQSFCKIPRAWGKKCEIVDKLEKRNRHIDTDIHEFNVGLYRNRPVLFDW